MAEERLADAERRQAEAADPNVSAFVRANAGTGKTAVLVRRLLRLLLAGAAPSSILCLTYTNNAAAEMEARVLTELSRWAIAPDGELALALTRLLGRPPEEAETASARTLFARVIDAPGGLAVMTIHGFCERVLRRYALEAGVPPAFTIFSEEEQRAALEKAKLSAFGPEASADLEALVAFAGEEQFTRILEALLKNRASLLEALGQSATADPVEGVILRLRAMFALGEEDSVEQLFQVGANVVNDDSLQAVSELLRLGSSSDLSSAERLAEALSASSDEARFEALKKAFLTDKLTPRAALMTGKTEKAAGPLASTLKEAQDRFVSLHERLCALKAIEATAALLRLAYRIFEAYAAEKSAAGALDFDDLIEKALSLLHRADAADWVLYQLDSRIDHILIDEAQDTAPAQWAIVEKLTCDFFAGDSARDKVPTIFAVGDEKQSIYGFQGARPELLAQNARFYERKVREARLAFRSVDLNLSFRTLQPILDAVDAVCAALPKFTDTPLIAHLAHRDGEGAVIEAWEPYGGEKVEAASAFSPQEDDEAAKAPARELAGFVADKIKGWLDGGVILPSQSRPIRPDDILILLRKREPMAGLLQAALRARNIPLANADRVALLETLVVRDLLALIDALALPGDDLALAAVLKGPLFGIGEEELFSLCHGRAGTLWAAVADTKPDIGRRLEALRSRFVTLSPFEFFARLLEAEGGRAAFASRLGPACHDLLDEFLALAETFSARPDASLSHFAPFVRASALEVAREAEKAAGEVRIMTVHGAKGLESNIVILPDVCRQGGEQTPRFYLLDEPGSGLSLPIWAVKGTDHLAPIAAAAERRKAAEVRESARLLYVAMTRAKDRLYLAGYHNGTAPAKGSWHDFIMAALAPRFRQTLDEEGRKVWRIGGD